VDARKSWVSRKLFTMIDDEEVLMEDQCIEPKGSSEMAGPVHDSELKVPSSSS